MKTKFQDDEFYDLTWYLGLDHRYGNSYDVIDKIKKLINNPDYVKEFITEYEDWVEEKRKDIT